MLKDSGLKATPQRLSVLKVLSKHTHPTIDELYSDIKKDYPSISLATVYKNLSALVETGMVVEVPIPNQKTKFDIYEKPHIHVVCECCGAVYDVFEDDIDIDLCKSKVESKFGGFVKKFTTVAVIDGCSHCQN